MPLRVLDLGEDVGGEANGAPASDSGGVLPGSAGDVGNAVDDDDTGGLCRLFLPEYSPFFVLFAKNLYVK